jgi:biopolymer transport protein ExbD
MRRERSREEQNAKVNLIPVMGIMVILIPIVIYMFTFHQVRVHQVFAPRKSTAAVDTLTKATDLTVTIRESGAFIVSWQTPLIERNQETIAGTDFAHEFNELERRVASIVERITVSGEKVGRIKLTADNTVRWDIISKTMDAIRGPSSHPDDPHFAKIVLAVLD